jgi:hypothetical protein
MIFSQFDIDYVKQALLSAESVFAVYENEKITKVKIVNALVIEDTNVQNEQTSSEIYVVFDGDYNVTAIKGEVESTYEQEMVDDSSSSSNSVDEPINCLVKEVGKFEVKTANGKPIIPSWVSDNAGGESPAVPQIPEISEEYLGDFVDLDETGISALITALNGKTTPYDRDNFVSYSYMLEQVTNEYQTGFMQRFIDESGNLYDYQNLYGVRNNNVEKSNLYYADGYVYVDLGTDKIKIAMSKEDYLNFDTQNAPTILTVDGLISALTSGEYITSVKAVKNGESFTKVEIEGNASLYVEGLDGTIIINIVFDEDGNIDMIRYEMNAVTSGFELIQIFEYLSNSVPPTAPSDLNDYVLVEQI